ncbi:DUF6449 domain-containing protein [Fictibacillus iocasae]|uniref:DUF6449 domain-containing protein n=1 Tax=Fictibacillus iocasae TaxID=2715437 RepID=A0ABW2NLX4_9BACL
MRSRTSLFNKELFVQTFRTAGWISIVYLVALLFALPLRIATEMTNHTRLENYIPSYETLFHYHFEIQLVFMFGTPILLALVLFRYLQSKQAAVFIHSLPIKRTNLLHQFTAAGLLFILMPVLITAFILLLMHSSSSIEPLYSSSDVMLWTGQTLLFTCFTFILCIFVGMLTGMTAVQGVITLIMLLFPYGISVLVIANLSFFLNGFAVEYYSDQNLESLSPFLMVPELMQEGLKTSYFIIYILIAAALYVTSILLYKKRRIESVSQAVSIRGLQPFFIYGITLCFMLLAGVYYGQTQNSAAWIFFGYTAGSLIGYLIAVMIVEKTWRVASHWRGYAVYAAGAAAILFLLQLDLTGYEKNVPEEKRVQSVYLLNSYYEYAAPEEEILTTNKLTSKENIRSVQRLHESIISRNDRLAAAGPGDYLFIAYELTNGEKLIREFKLPSRDAFKEELRPIIQSKEYKKATNPVAAMQAEEVEKIKIRANNLDGKSVTLTDPGDMVAFTKLAQQELFNERYDGANEHAPTFSTVEFLLNDNTTHFMEFKTSYKTLETWLSEKGEMKNARIMPDDLSYAIIYKLTDPTSDPYHTKEYSAEYFDKMVEQGEAVKVTETQELDQLIRHFHSGSSKDYMAALFFKDRKQPEIGNFHADLLPEVTNRLE